MKVRLKRWTGAVALAASSLLLALAMIPRAALSEGSGNAWQVVGGIYEGNTAANKTVSGDGALRIQKNVIPTDVENEFQVYMAVDAMCTETVTSTKITELLTDITLYTGGSANGFPTSYPGQEHDGNGSLAENLKGSPKSCEPGDIRFKLVITYEKDGHTYLIAEPILSLGVPNSVLYLKVGDDFICLENIQINGGRITIGDRTPEMDADGNYLVPVHLTTMAYNALMTTHTVNQTTTTSALIVGEDGSASITDPMGGYIAYDGFVSGDVTDPPAALTEPGATVNWMLAPKPIPAKPMVPADATSEIVEDSSSTSSYVDDAGHKIETTTTISTTRYTWTTEDGRTATLDESITSVVAKNLWNGSTTEETIISSSWWAENIVEIAYKVHLAVDKEGFASGAVYPVNDTTTLYYGDGKQAVFSAPTVRGTLYDFSFAKVDDKGSPLPNVAFTLTGPSGNPDIASSSRMLVSGSDGTVSVAGLPWGTYALTEIAPAGYTGSDQLTLDIGYTAWPDKVTHKEAANDIYAYAADWKIVNTLNTVTVNKSVAVFGDLTLDEVDHTIYIALRDKDTGKYVTDGDGSLIYKTVIITDGEASPARVVFEGVPSGEYDVMELSSVEPITTLAVGDKVANSNGTEIQVHAISAMEEGGSSGNDAILTNGVSAATVSFTNTYAHADTPITFTANKKWATYSGTGIAAPEGASVTFTLYRTTANSTDPEEVASVALDGVADEAGELNAWEATFAGLPNQDDNGYAYTYMVRETSCPDGYIAYLGNRPMEDGYLAQNGGSITNRKQSTDVAVKKVVSGHHSDDQAFSFTATYGETSATFELMGNETKVLEDVPVGAQLTVAETAVDIFSTTVSCGNDTAVGTEYTCTVAEPADTIVFTNTRRVGDLNVSKTVASALPADTNAEFEFTVTLDDASINGTYGGATFANGVATIKLKHNETASITGLPVGVGYVVTEEPAPGFTTQATGDTGTISTTPNAAAFTNTRETGDLTISKTVVSPVDEHQDQEFSFIVWLTPSISGTFGNCTFSNGAATVRLKSGESAVIEGLPTGVGYQVSETEVAGFEASPLDDEGYPIVRGTITADGAEAAFTNTYKAEGSATIEVAKAVSGASWPAGKTLALTIAGSDDAPMPATATVELTAAGTASFGPIAYDESDIGKTYTYTITEGGFGEGWAGDPESVTATVAVADNGDGTLKTTVTYSPEDATITNTYSASGSATLSAAKSLVGRDWMEGESYTFTLTDADGAVLDTQAVTEDNAGNVAFSPIEYTEADAGKTYTYTITETGDLPANVTKSGSVTATVTITDNGDGTLGTEVAYSPDNATIVNTYEPTPVKAKIDVNKTIGGYIPGADTAFTFTMTPVDGAPGEVQTKTITTENGTGTTSFDEIEYTEVGEYAYTVVEAAGSAAGFTYDTAEYTVTVRVTDNPEEGRLEAAVEYATADDTAVEIVNEFKEKGTEVTLHVDKVIDDQSGSAEDATFTFVLTPGEGAPGEAQTITVTTQDLVGGADFAAIEFTESGTFAYTIQETGEAPNGWTYDTAEYPVVIVVTDNFETAILDSETTIGGETTTSLAITNVYKAAETTATLKVTKAVDGTSGSAPDATFEFTLATPDGSPLPETTTASITGAGEVAFGEIVYERVGEYHYTITETKGGGAGWANDTSTYPVVVTVSDEGGQLVATAAYGETSETSLTITNIYDPEDATAALKARKVIDDQSDSAPDETFTFQLLGPDGSVVETATLVNGGYVEFGELTFAEVGTFEYVIQEIAGSTPGFDYDTAPRKAAVTVSDNGDGVLSATVAYADGDEAVITNTYKAEPVDVTLRGTKELVNKTLEEGEFAFELSDADGNVVATATNAADGSIDFGTYTFEQAGTFTMTATEVKGPDAHIAYDSASHTFTIAVTDEGGGLKAEVAGDEGEVVKFTNTYKPDPVTIDPPVKKAVTGDVPEIAATFTFQMKALTDGAPMPDGSADGIKTVQITGPGSMEFGVIEYAEPGEWTYEITEINDGAKGYTYDTTVYTLKVTVARNDDGTLAKTEELAGGDSIVFTNTYEAPKTPKKPETPKTGDATPQAGIIALTGAVISGIAAAGALRRRKD